MVGGREQPQVYALKHALCPVLPHPLELELLLPLFLSLCSAGVNSKSARVLFLLVIPGHLVFLYTIHLLQGGHTSLSFTFVMFYLAAALLQVNPNLSSKRDLSDNINPAFSRLKRSHSKTSSSSLCSLSSQVCFYQASCTFCRSSKTSPKLPGSGFPHEHDCALG